MILVDKEHQCEVMKMCDQIRHFISTDFIKIPRQNVQVPPTNAGNKSQQETWLDASLKTTMNLTFRVEMTFARKQARPITHSHLMNLPTSPNDPRVHVRLTGNS